MRNIALLLQYDGTAYHGWQIQKNAVTVCGTLTGALAALTGETPSIHGCGRTDAGVHARYYVANVRSDTRIPTHRLPYALNARLPRDIAVLKAAEVPDSFHSIQSATGKEYTYYLYTAPHRAPLYHNRAYHYPALLNPEILQEQARHFVGEHDFACVRSVGTETKTTIRTMYEFEVTCRDQVYAFRMKANGFLYNMARTLVGTLLYAHQGKITDIPALIQSGNRTAAGPTMPPQGLFMTGVWYDGGEPFEEN